MSYWLFTLSFSKSFQEKFIGWHHVIDEMMCVCVLCGSIHKNAKNCFLLLVIHRFSTMLTAFPLVFVVGKDCWLENEILRVREAVKISILDAFRYRKAISCFRDSSVCVQLICLFACLGALEKICYTCTWWHRHHDHHQH